MNVVEYAIAYKEVIEILKYVSESDYNKIPIEKIQLFEQKQDKNYDFQYNPLKTLDEQNVSKRARAILGLLFRDYWATEMQRQKILAKQNYELQKIEKEKSKKYNPDDIFKNNQIEKTENIINDDMQIIEYKEKKWYQKLLDKIQKIFRKN